MCSDLPGTRPAHMNNLTHTCRAITGKSVTREGKGTGTYPEGRLSGLALLPGSTLPPGCRNLAASEAELLPAAEAAVSRLQVPAPSAAPSPSQLPSGMPPPLCSESTGASRPGASSPVGPGPGEARALSSGNPTWPGAGASSGGAGACEDDSPLAAKAMNKLCDSDDEAEPSAHSGASGTDKNKTG